MSKQIIIEDLVVKLKDRVLYDHLNLRIEVGSKYVFLGPNGIGKSLLFELIFLGYSNELASRYKGLTVTGNIVDEEGKDLLNPSEKRGIAYVSQDEQFYRGMTIKEMCQTSCNGAGIELNENKLDDLLSRFGILEKKNQKIKNNLSFGEGKIVHIISRLLKLDNMNLLLLDEPLNHLSFKNSKVLNDIIAEEIIKNPGLSIIMISHCRAMNFANEAMVYNVSEKNIVIKPYQSYDCFTHNDYDECF